MLQGVLMPWSVVKGHPLAIESDLLVWTAFSGSQGPELAGELSELASLVPAGRRAMAHRRAFTAKPETWLLLPQGEVAPAWVLLIGLGKREELSLDRLRRAAGVAARQARRIKADRCSFAPSAIAGGGFDLQTVARCWVEGVELALSPTDLLKSEQGRKEDPAVPPREWMLIQRDGRLLAALRRGVNEGLAYAEGCLLARRLVNLPANHLTPAKLAQESRQVARQAGYVCRVLGPAPLATEKMGGLLAVAQGSRQQPCLIVLESAERTTSRKRRLPLIALIGKGVTFDAGGISLKPPAKMDLMKTDMSGAAAVLGAALIIARLRLAVRLLVVIPAAENLPDGRAFKPGDVITMASGRTVEVINTDAEGRLLLADALHFACRWQPDYLIDAATLTGACATALGEHFAGLMGNSAELLEVLQQAGGETFERVWHLPMVQEHHKAMESQVADLKNIGPREAGMSTAAAFLAAFVNEQVPWAHLDIAGTVWTDKTGPLGPKGATGYGARLLARAVQILLS
jgi:leucyl aminopeptidase